MFVDPQNIWRIVSMLGCRACNALRSASRGRHPLLPAVCSGSAMPHCPSPACLPALLRSAGHSLVTLDTERGRAMGLLFSADDEPFDHGRAPDSSALSRASHETRRLSPPSFLLSGPQGKAFTIHNGKLVQLFRGRRKCDFQFISTFCFVAEISCSALRSKRRKRVDSGLA